MNYRSQVASYLWTERKFVSNSYYIYLTTIYIYYTLKFYTCRRQTFSLPLFLKFSCWKLRGCRQRLIRQVTFPLEMRWGNSALMHSHLQRCYCSSKKMKWYFVPVFHIRMKFTLSLWYTLHIKKVRWLKNICIFIEHW